MPFSKNLSMATAFSLQASFPPCVSCLDRPCLEHRIVILSLPAPPFPLLSSLGALCFLWLPTSHSHLPHLCLFRDTCFPREDKNAEKSLSWGRVFMKLTLPPDKCNTTKPKAYLKVTFGPFYLHNHRLARNLNSAPSAGSVSSACGESTAPCQNSLHT